MRKMNVSSKERALELIKEKNPQLLQYWRRTGIAEMHEIWIGFPGIIMYTLYLDKQKIVPSGYDGIIKRIQKEYRMVPSRATAIVHNTFFKHFGLKIKKENTYYGILYHVS